MNKMLTHLNGYKREAVLAPLFKMLEATFDLFVPLVMADIVNVGITAHDFHYILVRCGILLLLAVVGLACSLTAQYFSAKAAVGYSTSLRHALFEHIQRLGFTEMDTMGTSTLITRMTSDINQVQSGLNLFLRLFLRSPFVVVGAMIMAFTINAKLASIYLVAVIILGGCLVLIMSRASNYFSAAFKKYDDLNESVQENVSAIRVVKAYVREKFEGEKFRKASENVRNLLMRAELIIAWNAPFMQLTVYSCILLISWKGAHLIIGGTLTTGELTSLFSYIMSALMALMMLSMIFVMITMSVASARRICEVLNEKSDITNPENPVMEIMDGSIDFDHVNFTYKHKSDQLKAKKSDLDGGEEILNDIDLHIHSGETIGIIGGTGCGKSTFASLISRLYDVDSGSVRVGGVDVRKYDLELLRDKVAVVLQKNVLFSGTILDNLRWGNENATEAECEEACRLACADEFIERMPDRYSTMIEQGGANVSGGQKQRLCIARALLKSPKILILDDSTSAVDTATDAKIRQAFAEKIPGTTKIIIAQRISSVKDADRIIVMDDGSICGFAPHDELLKTNEIYREIYTLQTQSGGDFDKPNE